MPETLRTAFGRYKLMAYIVGTGLVILVFLGIPLRYGLGFPYVAEYVGALHGILYVVYVITCLELLFHYRLKWYQLFFMAAAGWVPFLSFVVERKMAKYLQTREDVARRNSTPAPTSAGT